VRRVVWSQDALAEPGAVVAYIGPDNPAAAFKVADRIEETIHNLASTPTGRRGRVAGTYEKVIPRLPYIVAYALARMPAGEEVLTILRVIHGARDWPAGRWPDVSSDT
jgi:toxin ParE1/3/4